MGRVLDKKLDNLVQYSQKKLYIPLDTALENSPRNSLRHLSQQMEISYDSVRTATKIKCCFRLDYYVPEINSWGWLKKNTSWNGMMGMLQRGEVHMGACAIFVTPARADTVDFTMPLLNFKYSVFIQRPSVHSMVWNSLIKPFTPELWGFCGIAMIVTALHLWLLNICLRHFLKDRGEELRQYTFQDTLFCLISIFFQQGADINPHSISGRVVILTASLVAVTLYAGYSATLVSFLATDSDDLQFNTLYSLLEAGDYKLGCVKDSAEFFYLRVSYIYHF
ncbi:hypothetical protein ANN_19554 [Periplaneta americana]|uniref:Ionotropic glutamate receptor C-terminal domain-containing protein n=1 Tax=Periplaneta americana TaxID=6978 RepID=A0ABQ8SA90_PERAM|nr:hypothetical protein ANN_19554 [Periplaneta americana]